MTRLACPHCGTHTVLEGRGIGMTYVCPSCGGAYCIPRPATTAARSHPADAMLATSAPVLEALPASESEWALSSPTLVPRRRSLWWPWLLTALVAVALLVWLLPWLGLLLSIIVVALGTGGFFWLGVREVLAPKLTSTNWRGLRFVGESDVRLRAVAAGVLAAGLFVFLLSILGIVSGVQTRAARRTYAARVSEAKQLLRESRFDEAEGTLNYALAMRRVEDHSDAEATLSEVRHARTREEAAKASSRSGTRNIRGTWSSGAAGGERRGDHGALGAQRVARKVRRRQPSAGGGLQKGTHPWRGS